MRAIRRSLPCPQPVFPSTRGGSTAVVRSLGHASGSPGGAVKTVWAPPPRVSDSLGLGWSPKSFISNKFPGGTSAVPLVWAPPPQEPLVCHCHSRSCDKYVIPTLLKSCLPSCTHIHGFVHPQIYTTSSARTPTTHEAFCHGLHGKPTRFPAKQTHPGVILHKLGCTQDIEG